MLGRTLPVLSAVMSVSSVDNASELLLGGVAVGRALRCYWPLLGNHRMVFKSVMTFDLCWRLIWLFEGHEACFDIVLFVGWIFLQINEEDVSAKTQSQVVNMLRSLPLHSTVQLIISRVTCDDAEVGGLCLCLFFILRMRSLYESQIVNR